MSIIIDLSGTIHSEVEGPLFSASLVSIDVGEFPLLLKIRPEEHEGWHPGSGIMQEHTTMIKSL